MSPPSGADPLRRAAARRPDALAADGRDAEWSYRRLDREAGDLARRVRHRLDAARGDVARAREEESGGARRPRVAAFLPRRPAALAAVHGIPRAGAVLAPLQRGWTDAELSAYLRRLDPDLVVGPPDGLDRASRAGCDAPGLRLGPGAEPRDPGDAVPEGTTSGDASPADQGPAPGGDHSLIATSGSTGAARAVRLTWGNHLASARGAGERLGLRPDDRWYASLSLAHVGGLALAVRAAVVGSAVVLRGGFDAGTLSRLADRGRVSHASLVPVMLRRLLDARDDRPLPDTFRAALVGGAGAPAELVERALAARVPVALTYGLSEACSQVATAAPDLVKRKPGTAGPPLPGVRLRIGENGEILVRGATVSPGYLDGEPALTEGWLRTGDEGRLDGDGHLRVTGRLSERIVTGGTTVHPSEVEEVLREHPSVREAAAAGVPSEDWGEVVGAAVVLADRASGDGPDRSELESHCRERLSTPRRPRRWVFPDELPRLASGKTDREAVRDLLRRERDDGEERRRA